MTDNSNEKKTVREVSRQVPIRMATNGLAQWTNHIAAQDDAGGVYLTFFQINPPMILGNEEEKAAALQKIEFVEAPLVAKLIMDQDMAIKLRDLLTGVISGMTATSGEGS